MPKFLLTLVTCKIFATFVYIFLSCAICTLVPVVTWRGLRKTLHSIIYTGFHRTPSLLQYESALDERLYPMKQDIDILLVSETHFTSRNHFSMPHYKFYSTNHPDQTAHGGTAIIIKTQINHHAIEHHQKDYLQATNIVIEDWRGTLVVSAVYCPPLLAINQTQFESFFSQLGHRFIAGGDWNAKHPWWGSRLQTPNPRGRQLYEAIQKHDCITISTGEPTYWPSDPKKRPDLIDFAVAKGIKHKFRACSSLDLTSDHSPVTIVIDTPLKSTLRTKQKTNWTKFKEIVQKKVHCNMPLRTAENLERSVEEFNTILRLAVTEATTTTAVTLNHSPLPNIIKEKIKEKRKLRKEWQNSRNIVTKRKLNKTIRELKVILHEEKNDQIKNYLQNLTPMEDTDYSLWKATKRINKPQKFIAPIRKETGEWARSDKEKGQAFARHLEGVFKPYDRVIPFVEEQLLLTPYESTPPDETPIAAAKITEIMEIIRNIKPKKAPGHDSITGRMLKELPPIAYRAITIIINACLRLSHFPTQWKESQIILIQKPGKEADKVSSYRPISLLPVLSKICEKIILSRMKKIIDISSAQRDVRDAAKAEYLQSGQRDRRRERQRVRAVLTLIIEASIHAPVRIRAECDRSSHRGVTPRQLAHATFRPRSWRRTRKRASLVTRLWWHSRILLLLATAKLWRRRRSRKRISDEFIVHKKKEHQSCRRQGVASTRYHAKARLSRWPSEWRLLYTSTYSAGQVHRHERARPRRHSRGNEEDTETSERESDARRNNVFGRKHLESHFLSEMFETKCSEQLSAEDATAYAPALILNIGDTAILRNDYSSVAAAAAAAAAKRKILSKRSENSGNLLQKHIEFNLDINRQNLFEFFRSDSSTRVVCPLAHCTGNQFKNT
ncbi:unnamed protein product, partial [Trichogramma brassicae]